MIGTMAINRQRNLGALSLVLLGLVFVAAVTANNSLLTGLRIDLTDENLYTVSPGTRNVLASIVEPINVYLFFSDTESADIAPLRNYANRVREMLEELGLGMDRIVRTDVHLANIVHFDEMDRAYREFFETGRYPARTTVESPNMFGGSLVEVTCMARLNPT